jgi:hypothetical protein
MPRTLSYLHRMSGNAANDLPLLRPPSPLMQRWEMMSSRDVPGETGLSAQAPFAAAIAEIGLARPLSAPTQRQREPQLAQSLRKVTEISAAPESGLPSNRPSRGQLAAVPAVATTSVNISTSNEEATSPANNQKSQVEVEFTPIQSVKRLIATHGTAVEKDRSLTASEDNSSTQATLSERELRSSISLRPNSLIQSEPTEISRLSRSRRTENFAFREDEPGRAIPLRPTQVTRATQAQEGSTTSSPEQQAQQRASIHIGTIEVQIVQPPAVPAPVAPSSAAKPRSTSALSREFTSFLGLRQG